MQTLNDRVAVITGASSGIGRAYAKALADQGVSLVLTGRDRERLAAVADSVHVPTQIVAGDIADPSLPDVLVKTALDRFGRLDIVLPNAGLYVPGDFAEADMVAVRSLIDANVVGVMGTVRAALPTLIAQGAGDIIVTSSVSGHQAIHWEPVYSASKHAIQAFTHGVRRQLVGSGVRLGAIAPGVVLNELWGVDADGDIQRALGEARGITSDDVADAVVFMLTRPPHVGIRDLVILPTAQEI